MANLTLVPAAIGETVILLTLSLHPVLIHLLAVEEGCSRMTELSPTMATGDGCHPEVMARLSPATAQCGHHHHNAYGVPRTVMQFLTRAQI